MNPLKGPFHLCILPNPSILWSKGHLYEICVLQSCGPLHHLYLGRCSSSFLAPVGECSKQRSWFWLYRSRLMAPAPGEKAKCTSKTLINAGHLQATHCVPHLQDVSRLVPPQDDILQNLMSYREWAREREREWDKKTGTNMCLLFDSSGQFRLRKLHSVWPLASHSRSGRSVLLKTTITNLEKWRNSSSATGEPMMLSPE